MSVPLTADRARRIRRLAEKQMAIKAELDQEIYDACAEGASLRAVADAALMTHGGIRKILQRLASGGQGSDT